MYGCWEYVTLLRRVSGSVKVLKNMPQECMALARIIHEPDRLWRKAFQPEAVVIYCEG